MSTQEHINLVEQFAAHNYHPLPVVLTRGEGVWVEDVEGNRYLDMLASYSALNQGHRHPKILKALIEQVSRICLTSRAFHNDQLGPFCKLLCEITGQDQVLLMNSGAEGVETAIKCARRWGYKKKGVAPDKAEIVVCANNFHGRTITIISFSTEPLYQDGFGPFTPGFRVIPYNDIDALQGAINENTVGFLVEPIQGEGGIIVPDKGYLKAAQEVCQQNRVLLILDEIQTGMGRTGKLFCYQYEDVKPDLLILGKALGGGCMPVSAVCGPRAVMDAFVPGNHGSTFGGNPLACAVGRAAVEVILEEKLPERSAELGEYFLAELKKLNSPRVADVRGRGLFIGVELKPDAGPARLYCEELLKLGILAKDTHEKVIRFAPPLVIKKEEIDWALERIGAVLKG
ncbi:MAG: ornithine--oxo-acid transaminase [candidate division WOR-3 bacterium]|nr:ornithine--oxo-acid transaminase [candidate division WOR-3 bacterium]